MMGCQTANRSLVLRRGMADSVRFMEIRQRLGQSDSPSDHGRDRLGLDKGVVQGISGIANIRIDLLCRKGIGGAREIQIRISQL